MDLFSALAVAIWVMLPAYVPNNVAVLAGGGRPIDGHRVWRGKRVLGDGKTWRGAVAGIVSGIMLAGALNVVNPEIVGVLGVDLPTFSMRIALALPIGAILGDMFASFGKRRVGRKRGTAVPGLDQLDFVVVALVLAAIVDWGWFLEVFTITVIVIVFIVTPVLHITTNMIGYALGLKHEPW